MNSYTVVWRIDILAKTAEDAARQALDIQRDPFSFATVFEVSEFGWPGDVECIDVDALNED